MTADWIDNPKDRYCCPDSLRDFAAAVWPEGIDRDAFYDPLSWLKSLDPYSIRGGDDTLQLDIYAPLRCGRPGAPTMRVHTNGPYTRANPTMTPSKWVPHCADRWRSASLWSPVELLIVCPLSPTSAYWNASVWPCNPSVVLSGRVNFEVEGSGTSGARHEVAQCFFSRDPERHKVVTQLAYQCGWGVARRS